MPLGAHNPETVSIREGCAPLPCVTVQIATQTLSEGLVFGQLDY